MIPARIVVGAAIALPWLAALPLGGIAGVLAAAIALVAALHGWGCAIAPNQRANPLLVALWGAGALSAIAGLAIALHVYSRFFHVTVVFGGIAIHSVVVARRFRESATSLAPQFAPEALRWWMPVVVLIALVGVGVILGAAGDVTARPFDDDGNVLGNLRALADTGALTDPIGAPRTAQLGGSLALLSLGNAVIADPHFIRFVDAVAMVVALALAIVRIRPKDALTATYAGLLVLAAFAVPYAIFDAAPAWLAVALVVGLVDTSEAESAAPPHVVALLAAAIVALRLELAPLAAIVLLARTRRLRHLAIALAAIAPYVVARTLARGSVPSAARKLVEVSHGSVFVHLAIAAGVGLAAWPLLLLLLDQTKFATRRWLAGGAAASLGTIAGSLVSPAAYGGRFAWPIAFALALVLVTALAARGRTRAAFPFVVVLALALAVPLGATATGRQRWQRRVLDELANLTYLHDSVVPLPGTSYATALAHVPPTATLALAVEHPELVDHRSAARVFDIATPRIERAKVLEETARLAPTYLLTETAATVPQARLVFADGAVMLWAILQ